MSEIRPIRFRGKRLDNSEWVESECVLSLDEGAERFMPRAGEAAYTHSHENGNIELIIGSFYKVDPSTIGQYTGLTDKNGVKIFEGDICENLRGQRGAICYGQYIDCSDGKQIGFYLAGRGCMLCGVYAPDTIEVIGNIHDNPELMEEDHE